MIRRYRDLFRHVPVALLQLSVVQTWPSSQLGAAPPTQDPALQVSLVVHALPSSQGAVLGVCAHPLAGLQLSSVHGLPSLHGKGLPAVQAVPTQVSPKVQTLPSVQSAAVAQVPQTCRRGACCLARRSARIVR